MEPKFWHERWELNEIGFHQTDVSPMLSRLWPAIQGKASQAQVFVPLCGKSLDMMWLRNQGHAILGVEISPIAIRSFFDEQALVPATRKADGFEFYEAESLELLCGDFFDLQPRHVKNVKFTYDRAALIALPPALQVRYAEHMLYILPQRPPILLITFEYDPMEMDGPPFSTSEENVRKLFGNAYKVENMTETSILEEHPGLRERGLTRLTEKAYVLR